MSFIEGIIVNLLYTIFPIIIYLILKSSSKSIKDEQTDNIVLSLLLISSLYLILRLNHFYDLKYCIILCNFPLLISYLKNLKTTSIILSLGIIYYYHQSCNFSLPLVTIEYLIYYFIYIVINRKEIKYSYLINTFILIKAFILSIQEFYIIRNYHSFINSFLYILILIVGFYIISHLVFYLFDHIKQILNLNSTLKELEKEKVLRSSLFKLTHEIKNPIAVCKGYLDMLNSKDQKKLDKYLPIIKSEINRTLVIMDDFLDYSKIKVNKDIVDVEYLIEDTLKSLKYLLKKNNVSLKKDLIEDEIYIEGDYDRLKQVLINIFKNAIEAKKDDMIICLNTRIKNKKLIIEIIDNGIGMDKETLSKVYETFYTTKKNGTGLGVAISKEIIELHKGSIKYDSWLGIGTKVTIKLPLYNLSLK